MIPPPLSPDSIPRALDQASTGALVLLGVKDTHGCIEDFRVVYANDAFVSLAGEEVSASELVSTFTLASQLKLGVPPMFLERLRAVVETGTPDGDEVASAHEGRWLTWRASRVDEGIFLLISEVTGERASRVAKAHETQLLKDVYEEAPFAACVVGGTPLAFEFVNDSFEDLVGEAGLNGRQLSETLKGEEHARELCQLLQSTAADGQQRIVAEYPLPQTEESARFLRIVVRPVATSDQSERSVQLTAIDVTALVEARLRAVDLAQKLAEEQSGKDEFLAVLGHELRNPLAALRHASMLLSDNSVDPELKPVIDIVERQTKHMGRLVDDLLDVGRIARGKFDFREEHVEMCQIVRFALDDLESARLPSQEFEVDVPPGPLWVKGDSARLLQATQNLLNNAVKYTPADGKIVVRLRATEDSLLFSVEDNGVGLDPDLADKLFLPFEQAPQDLSRSQGGLGLGLALTSKIIEHHEGTIRAESAGRGKGALFEFCLPREKTAQASPSTKPPEAIRRLRFLVVEDNRDAAELLEMLLMARGHEVSICTSGARALDAAKSQAPDVVLCDLGLPGRSGFEVASSIRDVPQLRGTTLIALSGYSRQEDVRRSLESGFDSHLTKPADVNRIFQELEDLGIHVDSTPGKKDDK